MHGLEELARLWGILATRPCGDGKPKKKSMEAPPRRHEEAGNTSPVPLQHSAARLFMSRSLYQFTNPPLATGKGAGSVIYLLQSHVWKSRYRIIPTEKLVRGSLILWFNIVWNSLFYKLKSNRLRYIHHRLTEFLRWRGSLKCMWCSLLCEMLFKTFNNKMKACD